MFLAGWAFKLLWWECCLLVQATLCSLVIPNLVVPKYIFITMGFFTLFTYGQMPFSTQQQAFSPPMHTSNCLYSCPRTLLSRFASIWCQTLAWGMGPNQACEAVGNNECHNFAFVAGFMTHICLYVRHACNCPASCACPQQCKWAWVDDRESAAAQGWAKWTCQLPYGGSQKWQKTSFCPKMGHPKP